MRRTRPPQRRSRHYVWAALLVVLGIAVMHADSGVFADASSHGAAAMAAGHGHDEASSTMPTPDDPSTPTDPCHRATQACCVAALPTAPPRQLFALITLALVVVIGATQLLLLRRGPTLGDGVVGRPPPDLCALCVLRI